MKKTTRPQRAGNLVQAPAYPLTGPQVFQVLRASLNSVWGVQPSYARLGRIAGASEQLTRYWMTVMQQRQVLAFIHWLEHLPEPARRALLNEKLCRELPLLSHPRLAHDPLAVGQLEQLLRLPHGLTWIHGGTTTQFQQTFVLTALGHSAAKVRGAKTTVAGLDLFEPRKWVPLESVVYLKGLLPQARVKALILEAWAEVRSAKTGIVVLNGVWSAAPELRGEIVGLARQCHVVVTVPQMPTPRELPHAAQFSVHVVTVDALREGEPWIRVKVESR